MPKPTTDWKRPLSAVRKKAKRRSLKLGVIVRKRVLAAAMQTNDDQMKQVLEWRRQSKLASRLDAEGAVPPAGPRSWTIDDEREAYKQIETRLVEEHDGQFVALHHGEVLAFGATPREALTTAAQRTPSAERPVIHRVGDDIGAPLIAPSWFRADAPRRAVDDE